MGSGESTAIDSSRNGYKMRDDRCCRSMKRLPRIRGARQMNPDTGSHHGGTQHPEFRRPRISEMSRITLVDYRIDSILLRLISLAKIFSP